MAGRRGGRRLIPIQRQTTIDFRFVGGKLDTEPAGSSIKWISCAIAEGTSEPETPEFIHRSAVTVVLAKPVYRTRFFRFDPPCSQDISEQIRTLTKIRE